MKETIFNYLDHLKEKWGLKSYLDIIPILIVFSLAGMSILKVDNFITPYLGMTPEKPLALRITVHILIFPFIYQVLLLLYSLPFGQFRFFWNKEKKIGLWILKKISRSHRH